MARLLLPIILAMVTMSMASPMKLYRRIPGGTKYQPIMVAVSSTVIPLDDLPTFTVSSRLGPASELPPVGVTRPRDPTRLITVHNKKTLLPKKVPSASVVELTKDQFGAH